MEQQIKNTLFRFSSIREPELANENGLNIRFVFFSENLHSGSYFYSAAAASDDKWNTLKDLSKTFENTAGFYSSESQI
ncbi:MAG: hypothetical protein H3C39_02795 [Flavobacteriia bacterium]|nr:hypothetical protein [Flavobacteriia bacterium]